MRKVLNRETSLDFPQCGVVAVLLISAALLSPPCLATEGGADSGDDDTQPDSTVTLGAGLLSKYAWRGLLLTDGPVIQPTVDVSHKGFVINVWCNMDLDDVNGNEREFNEIDLTLAYGGKVGPVRISGGVMHYTFPSTLLTDTSELFATATIDVLLQPTLSGYLDLDAAAGSSYWELVGGHRFTIFHASSKVRWSIDLTFGLGFGSSEYNDLYFGIAQSGMVDVLATASAPIELGRGWTLAPSVAYSSVIDGALRDSVEQPDLFIGGVTAYYGF